MKKIKKLYQKIEILRIINIKKILFHSLPVQMLIIKLIMNQKK